MAAHLRSLPGCHKCGRPATLSLHNARNATIGLYCRRCGPPALQRFWADNPDQAPPAKDAAARKAMLQW